MPRFFVQSPQISDGVVSIYGSDAHHISRALRMAVGDRVTVCDMARREYECELFAFLPECVQARVLSEHESATESPVCITLFQALPKGDKMDMIIQKAVECGAAEIVPFESERCIVRSKQDSEARKTERRTRIAEEAAKQCGRGVLPRVRETVDFERMLELAGKTDAVFFCYEGDGTVPVGDLLKELKLPRGATLSIVIGSEGGFSVEEARLAREHGFHMTGLGARILRTETASSFVLACISCAMELTSSW